MTSLTRLDQGGFQPGRLWSLWEMINYQVFGLVGWIKLLDQERRVVSIKLQALTVFRTLTAQQAAQYLAGYSADNHTFTEQDKERVVAMLDYGIHLCNQLNLTGTENRIVRFKHRLRGAPAALTELQTELQVLYDALEDDLRFKYFYFYPPEKAQRLLKVEADWASVFAGFKACKADAVAAVDCYALGHNNACVFNCMRVLEHGLRALAANVGLTFDVQQWKTIIDEIETKIDRIRDNGIPGVDKAAKDARLQFLSEAAKEFFYFKDGWRNYVSHGRASYDEHQALGALEHTRSFMSHLASQLSDESLA